MVCGYDGGIGGYDGAVVGYKVVMAATLVVVTAVRSGVPLSGYKNHWVPSQLGGRW